MSSRSSDVSLVIRARDEAQKTIDAVAGALNKLYGIQNKVAGSAEDTGQNIGQLATVLGTLDKAYTSLAGGAERAETAFAKQKAAVASQRQELQALQAQATAAQAALQRLNGADAIVSAGRDQSGRLSQIKVVAAEYDRLSGQINKLARSIATQEAGLNNSTSSLQKVSSTANAVEAAVAAARREIELQNKALREQAAAAQTAANVQRVTGTGRTAATDNGAGFEALARREIQLQEQRSAAARNAAAAVAESVRQTTGIGGGRATDNGASFQALAAREESAALKDAAIAHKLFEDRVRQGVTAMEDSARAEKAMADAAARLRQQLDPVADIEARLSIESKKLRDNTKLTNVEIAAGIELLKKKAALEKEKINGDSGLDSRGRPTLFGLKPYELTNFGYQVNDVVTQIASGTSITQTLAQQGGQLLQLFPRVGSSIAAAFASGPILAGAAALAGVVLILKDAYDRAERLRQLGGLLELGEGLGGGNTATGLNEATEALDHYGISAENALKIVRTLMKEGFDETQIVEFGKAAQNMADVLGIDVVDAAKDMADAFNGGYESILKLGKQTDLYTSSQYAQIKALFDAGKAEEARALAAGIAMRKLDEAAQKARGPWTDAARTLGEAWETALAKFSNSGFVQSLGHVFEDMAKGVKALVGDLEELGNVSLANAWWNTATGQPIPQTTMPNSLTGGKPTGIDPALFAKDANGKVNAAATAAAAQAADEAERQARAEAQITSQKQIQTRLEELRVKLRNQAIEQFGAGADPKEIDRFVNAEVDRERVKLNKELVTYRNQQKAAAEATARADEAALKSYVQRVVKAENSTGRADARNPASTATGNGQFIESTWLNLFRKYFPQEAENMGRDAILELRKNADVSAKLIELYARENAAALQKSGQAVTEANLHLAHFLGADGAVKVLKSAAGTKVASVLSAAAVNANPTILGNGATRESVLAYADRRAGGTSRGGVGETTQAAMETEAALRKIEQDRLDAQDKFNAKIDDENEKRQLGIKSMQGQLGLVDAALLAEQKKQAVAEAVLAKQQEIDKLNADRTAKGLPTLEFSDAQRHEIERTTAAYFDLAHARELATAQADTVQRPVDDLTGQRDAIQAQMEFLRNQGLGAEADSLQPMLDGVNAKLKEAIQNAITFYQTLDLANDPLGRTQVQIDGIVTRLQTALAGTTQWINVLGIGGQQIAQVFASQATSALNKFAQAVAEGKNVFSSLKDAFLSFAASFLQQIAQMIMQAVIFNIVASFLKAGLPGGGGGGSPVMGGAVTNFKMPSLVPGMHTGGVVGQDSTFTRSISPSWFSSATRYHSGGIAGLRPDEVPTILQKGEEVLTAGDPRHRDNGGMTPNVNLKVVNTIDAGEMVSEGLSTAAGEQAIFNMVRANRRAFREAMS